MVVPRIGNPKELDSSVIAEMRIVAMFGFCRNTLCVQDHALERYITRGEMTQPILPVLNELYKMLSISLVVFRRNSEKQKKKYGTEAVYRFEAGWIFVLTWNEQFKIWLLETAYNKDAPESREYDVRYTREAIRASAWPPSLV